MKNVILPPLEEFTAADLREGNAARAITRNNAINECAAAIQRAGGTFSHEIRVHTIYLDDGLRVDSPRCPQLGPRPQLRKIRTTGATAPATINEP